MKKGKGMLLALLIMVLIGIGITAYTRSYVISKSADLSMPSESEGYRTSALQEEAASSKEVEISTFEAKSAMVSKLDQNSTEIVKAEGEEVQSETMGAAKESQNTSELKIEIEEPATAVISPLSGMADTASYDLEADSKEQQQLYMTKLKELEDQIDKMWKEDTDSTTYSMKSTAEYEYKLWDKELNAIYSLLKTRYSSEEAEELKKEELEWIKSRDTMAAEAANKRSGGSMEGLEYTLSMTLTTKARTYELVEEYFSQEEVVE